MTQRSNIPHPGLRARDLRKQRGNTLDQIAEAANISKGHLSRFERGEKALSVAALLRLAEALAVSVGRLVGEELSGSDIHLVRAGETPEHASAEEGGRYVFQAISGPNHSDSHTTFLLEIGESDLHHADAFHSGRELLYVLHGAVHIKLGDHAYTVEKGDYLEFPGHIPHVLESLGGMARVLLIILRDD